MKFIKIFLASSTVEFENERRQLGDFIRTLNDTYVKKGIYFELTICEDLSNSLAMERKQQEYNQFIKDSQYFYVLFGKHAGAYTIEEFNVALEQFQASGSPRIFTYFQNLPDGQEPEQSVVDFMDRLDKQIGHYYSTFVHMDAIKLNILLELVRDPMLNSQVKFEDGQALVDHQPMLSLENMPLYSQNEGVQKLLRKQQQLNQEFAGLAVEYGKDPANGELLGRMMKLGEERARVSDSLHQMETDMLELYRHTSEKLQSGKSLNWREKKAIRCVDLGDYEGAKNILRDAQWENEIRQAEAIIDTARESIGEYISGKKALISTLTATGLNSEVAEEILAVYDRCCALAKDYGVELDILYDYSKFLFHQHQYPKAIAAGEELYSYHGNNVHLSQAERAKLARLLGEVCWWNQDYSRSEEMYQEAYTIYRSLTHEMPGTFEKELALTCSGLAVLQETMNRLTEAENLFHEALDIQKALVQANPAAYEEDLAYIYNNFAIFLQKINQLEEAEDLHRKVLEIYRRRLTDDPHTRELVAKSCCNLAAVLERNNKLEESLALGQEALEIRKKLAVSNPERYQPELALTCNNLAVTLVKAHRLEEAQTLYREALTIRRRLAQANPDAYRSDLAFSCSNLAKLLEKENQMEEAKALFEEALNIRRELAASGSPAYEEALAKSCLDTARLLGKVCQLEKAKALGEEALDIYRRLAKANPHAFEAPLANTYISVAYLLKSMNRHKEAEPLYRESLDIFRKLAGANPMAYAPSLEEALLQSGILFNAMGLKEEAENILLEAVEICLSHIRETPDIYEPRLASAYGNLGRVWGEQKPEKAGMVLEKALKIYVDLALRHPKVYEPEKARISFNLASLMESQGQEEKAEDLYEEAWQIYHDLADASPQSWYPYLSGTCYNLSRLKERLGKWAEAENLCREALKADRCLSALNPSVCWKYPAESASELARILSRRTEGRKEARELYLEVLKIYEEHPGEESEKGAQRIKDILENKF